MFLKDLKDLPENYGYLNARLRAHFSDFLVKRTIGVWHSDGLRR
jgi:hypothetical protein